MTPEEIDRWDPAQIGEVFRVCQVREAVCAATSDHLRSPTLFEAWGGTAAQAAGEAAGKRRADLDAHGSEVRAVAQAAADAQSEVVAVKRQLATARDYAESNGLVIDDSSGRVSLPLWESGTMNVDRTVDCATAQTMVNNVMARATAADRTLARAIQVAVGDLPLERLDSGGGLNRDQNRMRAFHKVYGRLPRSKNDWRMAEALDPDTIDPKYRGADSHVVVGRIEPRPGHGIVRTNLFIPGKEVQNFTVNPRDIIDGRAFPNNSGDNRAADPNASADASRVSIYVDYENGVVVARQNPTVVTSGPNLPVAGEPTVRVAQGPDGSVRVNYFATDTYQPELGKNLGIGVGGDITMSPRADGSVAVGGQIGSYPSAEIYHYKNDGTISTLATHDATGSQWGPMAGLPKGANTTIGEDVPQVGEPNTVSPQMGYPGTQQSRAPAVGTELGAADDPPHAPIVGSAR